MATEEKKDVVLSEDQKQQKALMQVVRNTVFKNSTDEELVLFFHICKSNGISPLDRMIHPTVYTDSNGNRTLTIVTSIDLFRSRSIDTGLEAGMDEPEFSGELKVNTENGEISVPEVCKVKVYKHGVDRPYVGTARWVEFYPGEKKGFMWRKMPTIMLAKCAEAQARRIAFPKEIGKFYEEAEMMQVTAQIAGVQDLTPQSTGKPVTTAPQAVGKPNDDIRKKNKWITEPQEKRIYGILKNAGVDIDDFKAWLKMCMKKDHLYMISWAGDEYKKICEHIEKSPKDFAGYAKKLSDSLTQKQEDATGKTAFQLSLEGYAQLLGKSFEEIDDIINAEFAYIGWRDVPEEQQETVLDHFKAMVEK